jgi:antitoxin HicB
MKKKNIRSSVDSWLREEGIYEEVTATAIKRILARQVEATMKEKHFSKAEMARRMHTSRAALDRLLDPGRGRDYKLISTSRAGYRHVCQISRASKNDCRARCQLRTEFQSRKRLNPHPSRAER